MNYRHIYHAGNFADVLKHAVLTRLIVYLQRKDKAFRVLDTHAGIGLYDLGADEAARTGEWRGGIARLEAADLSADAAALLAPYRAVVQDLNEGGPLTRYPGSPALVRALLRPQDRLSAIELHPADAATLAAHFAGDHQVRVTALDGWLALKSQLPPKERRGIVLVDPPFEVPGEYPRLVEGLVEAHRRFAGGLFCLWYPKKAGAPIAAFHKALAASGIGKILCAELDIKAEAEGAGLSGCGLILVNPPFVLEDELAILLPVLAEVLAQDQGAGHSLFWLSAGA